MRPHTSTCPDTDDNDKIDHSTQTSHSTHTVSPTFHDTHDDTRTQTTT